MAGQQLARLWAYRQPVEAELATFLDGAPAELGVELSKAAEDALRRLREYCLRPAKRIRGALAALAYDTATGQKHTEQGVRLGAVLELLHAYLLIVDDVMDKSLRRRGEPTIHESYIEADAAMARHEAEMLAIDIGLIAQHLANLLLFSIDAPVVALKQTTTLLHTNILITGIGQFDDLQQRPDQAVSEEAVLQKYRNKSSFYTFINPLQLGFALAGKADAELLEAVRSFGEPAGVAFQIRDDYLGIWGDEQQHGKSNLDDIREGKMTLLMAHAATDARYGADVQQIAGDVDAGNRELEQIRMMYDKSGATARAQQVMRQAVTEAVQSLHDHPFGGTELPKLLEALVGYATTRET